MLYFLQTISPPTQKSRIEVPTQFLTSLSPQKNILAHYQAQYTRTAACFFYLMRTVSSPTQKTAHRGYKPFLPKHKTKHSTLIASSIQNQNVLSNKLSFRTEPISEGRPQVVLHFLYRDWGVPSVRTGKPRVYW